MSYFIFCLLSPILLIILYLSNSQFSSSFGRILTEAQNFKGFLAFPNDSNQDQNIPQIQQETSSMMVPEAVKEANYDDFLMKQRRLQQDEPVLTSTQLTTIRPPPGPGKPAKPVIVTTETYVQDVKNEEEIIIEVIDNQDPLEVIETIENGQPQITNGEDVFISSWWTFEDEETAFENWEQLESFIGTQYGNEPEIGIDVNAEDVPVEVEIVVPKPPEAPNQTIIPNLGTQNINEDLNTGVINLTDIIQNSSILDSGQYEQEEIEGVGVVYASVISTGTPKCKQVQTCQKVYVRPIGYRNVCKNQMVCPKA